MKTFLNVLYRRILYKIPLKLLLVLLAVFAVLFACFSSADYTLPLAWFQGNDYINWSYEYKWQSVDKYNQKLTLSSDYDFYCFIRLERNNWWQYSFDNSTWYNWPNYNVFCDNRSVYIKNGLFLFYYYKFWQGMIPSQYTSLECQTVYNLIPIESVDQSYCESNNLCSSCPVCPSVPIWTWGYSQLYINNILHIWASNIIMNIPEEIDWDYAYTAWGQNMNIDVVGYNVDYEKIDEVVQLQNYKPTSEDFQKIIWLLAPYTKIIVFFVFLFIVWAWIKKPFKSKKL